MSDRAHTRLIRVLRVIIPGAALTTLVLLFTWPYLAGTGAFIQPVLEALRIAGVEPMQMANPRYVGSTADRRRYVVEADNARFDLNNPERIDLSGVRAELEAQQGYRLDAARAAYHREDERINLTGQVTLRSEDGYRFVTEQAIVDLAAQRVTGPVSIAGSGPAGRLRADTFRIEEGGARLDFAGNVKVTLQPRTDEATDATGAAAVTRSSGAENSAQPARAADGAAQPPGAASGREPRQDNVASSDEEQGT